MVDYRQPRFKYSKKLTIKDCALFARGHLTGEKNRKKETGVYGIGGRNSYDSYLKDDNWKNVCDEALRIASVNLESKPAPAGEMKVVLGPGWPAILIHEAVGHGLEGDFNRKKHLHFII